MYKVRVGNHIWIRHSNQIKKRNESFDLTSQTLINVFNSYGPDYCAVKELEQDIPKVAPPSEKSPIASRTRSKTTQKK